MDHPIQRLFATIGEPSRFRVLQVLVEGDFCVSEIARRVGLSQSCTTRHLQVLQREGLAKRTRTGKQVIFRLTEAPPELSRILEWAIIRQAPMRRTDGGRSPQATDSEIPAEAGQEAPRPRTEVDAADNADEAENVDTAEVESEPPDTRDLEDFLL